MKKCRHFFMLFMLSILFILFILRHTCMKNKSEQNHNTNKNHTTHKNNTQTKKLTFLATWVLCSNWRHDPP